MRPTSSTEGLGVLRDLQSRALSCVLEPISLNWISRVGVTIGFLTREEAETFVEALAYDQGIDIPEPKLFGDVIAPQISFEIKLEEWEIRVYARTA